MDREQIFQWILREDWKSLFVYLKANPQAAYQDEIVESAVHAFAHQYLASVGESPTAEDKMGLEELYLLVRYKKVAFAQADMERLILLLVRATKDTAEGYFYALRLPEHPECQAVIAAHQTHKRQEPPPPPRVPEHNYLNPTPPKSYRRGLERTTNTPTANRDARISLFKSEQDRQRVGELEAALRQEAARLCPHCANRLMLCRDDFKVWKHWTTTKLLPCSAASIWDILNPSTDPTPTQRRIDGDRGD